MVTQSMLCTCKEKGPLRRKKIRFVTALDFTECPKQIK